MRERKEILSDCNSLVDDLSEIENAFLELCGRDDKICYQEAKESLSKMKDVRDFVKSCT